MNFEMDSRNYAMMILSGLPAITSTLSMRVHEALYQRIVINYTFSGLTQTEVTSYIQSRLEICGVGRPIMEEAVYEVIGSYSHGSVRKLDHLMHKALMVGCSKHIEILDRETIMEAISEAELI